MLQKLDIMKELSLERTNPLHSHYGGGWTRVTKKEVIAAQEKPLKQTLTAVANAMLEFLGKFELEEDFLLVTDKVSYFASSLM